MDFVSCKDYVKHKKQILSQLSQFYPLSIVQIGDDYGSNIYVKEKLKDCKEVGIETNLYKMSTSSQAEFEETVKTAAASNAKVIIALPLPEHLYLNKNWFTPEQDIDGICYDYYNSCTAEGIINWLDFNEFNYRNSNIVVIGRGKTVGFPITKMLIKRGATVTSCNSHTNRTLLNQLIENADIIISATGHKQEFSNISNKPRLWIDTGIRTNEQGKLCGDLDPIWLTDHKQLFTPVPGGVGLLTRLTLLERLVKK